MYLQEVECEGVDWIELAQDRDWWREVVIAVMNLLVNGCRTSMLTLYMHSVKEHTVRHEYCIRYSNSCYQILLLEKVFNL